MAVDLSWLPMLSPTVDTALLLGCLSWLYRVEKKLSYIQGRLGLDP